MKILCVTHSSRPFVEARSSLNGLERRFAHRRSIDLPPFDSLPGVDAAVPFTGSLTLWAVEEGAGGAALRHLWHYDPGYKIQSATFVGDRLVVYGADRLEVLDSHKEVVRTFRAPWLCGGHTVFADAEGCVWVNSAPGNAIMRVDLETGELVEHIRMPDRYGAGYALGPDDDLHAHFVPTDLQPTHVNCAYPVDDGVLITLLIPGVVGHLDGQRRYRELVRGIRGCHGGKLNPAGDELYVTDSPTGLVWFFDAQSGEVCGRLKVDSSWLHDSHHVSDDVIAAGLSDRNEIRLIARRNGETLVEQTCDRFGKSVMFVNCCEAGGSWERMFARPAVVAAGTDVGAPVQRGANLLERLMRPTGWSEMSPEKSVLRNWIRIEEAAADSGYLAVSDVLQLAPGEYLLEADLDCRKGRAALELLAMESDRFLAQLSFDGAMRLQRETVRVDAACNAQLVLSADNGENPAPLDFVMREVSLRRKVAAGSLETEDSPKPVGIIAELQGEVQLRDEMLKNLQVSSQAEIQLRDQMLQALQDQANELQRKLTDAQLEINKRDLMLASRNG